MASDIAKQTTAARPSILAQGAKERINSTFNRLVDMGGRRELAVSQAPSAMERTSLRGRLSDLAVAMRPAETVKIRTLVGALLAGYPSGRAHREDADAVLNMFVQALRDLPEWSISAACSAWNRGEARGRNTSFAPSPSDLRAVALEQTEEFDRERHKIKAILDAEVVPEPESDEKRAEVAARVRKWLDDRTPKPDTMKPMTDDEFEAWRDDWLARVRADRPALSSAARNAAGLIDAMAERRVQPDMYEPRMQREDADG